MQPYQPYGIQHCSSCRAQLPAIQGMLQRMCEACARDALIRTQSLEFLCAVEVKDSAWSEWEDADTGFRQDL